jgi:hypothetical protein
VWADDDVIKRHYSREKKKPLPSPLVGPRLGFEERCGKMESLDMDLKIDPIEGYEDLDLNKSVSQASQEAEDGTFQDDAGGGGYEFFETRTLLIIRIVIVFNVAPKSANNFFLIFPLRINHSCLFSCSYSASSSKSKKKGKAQEKETEQKGT